METEHLNNCLCEPGSLNGVVSKYIQADDVNLELWAACAFSNEPYKFNCNHELLSKGSGTIFPKYPVKIYNDGDGSNPHLHFRKRLDEPHQLSSDIWKKMELNTCKCEENTENPEFVYGHRFTSSGIFPQNYYTSSHAVESSFNKIN